MASLPDLVKVFHDLEAYVASLPEGENAEIARGIFLMSRRGRVRHGATQTKLSSALERRYGSGGSGEPPPTGCS